MTVVNNVEDANLLAKYLCDPGLSVQEAMRLYRAELRARRRRVPLPASLQDQVRIGEAFQQTPLVLEE